MRTTALKRYKDRLDEMRSSLHSTIEQSVSAKNEDLQPPEVHESQLAEEAGVETTLERTEANLLHEVQAALDRLQEGIFGRCLNCGAVIAHERLEALPYAAYCIECERRQEQASQ